MKKYALIVGLLAVAIGVGGENPCDFRRRLEVVHVADRRDPAAKCAVDSSAHFAAFPLVERDSRLGWEPSMEYCGGPEQIRWKLNLMEKLYGKENLK